MIIWYLLTLGLLTIICICLYKLYLSVSIVGGKKQMTAWEKHCIKCGGVLDDKDTCYRCGYSAVTGISGNVYLISSATWSSPSFNSIADAFGNNVNSEKQKNELTRKPYITDETLADYLSWGYLQVSSDGIFKLTELGKDSVKKNRKERGIV